MKTIIKIIALSFILLLHSCEKEDKAKDSIKITSVTPYNNLINFEYYDFEVTVDYNLISSLRGELAIGFNTLINDTFIMKSEASTTIDKGSGSHTFNVSAMAKDWGSEGDFKVYVYLSEYPHSDSWKPLANDFRELTFE